MEQETVKFAWRTPKGEQNKMKSERNINNKKNVLRYCCNWYYCADENMQDEKVLHWCRCSQYCDVFTVVYK